MNIEFKEVPDLMNAFKKFFPAYFHITFKWMPCDAELNGEVKRITVINVVINNTRDGGAAEENWLLEYAYSLLKNPKELDACAQRWLTAFANAKRKATLDILGHKNVDAAMLAEPANNNSKLIH